MTIVKQSKDSNSLQLQKRQYPYWIKSIPHFITTVLLASLIGTYLDLYFVGKALYSFPIRPMPTVFSINITFTLIGLPILVGCFLLVCQKVKSWKKAGFIILISMLMSVGEKQAESFGLFVHHDSWKHIYTFVGYTLYLSIIYLFYEWLNSLNEKNK